MEYDHELKTDPEVFQATMEGVKRFEIRLNDRDFKVGNVLRLRETKYTGKAMAEGLPLLYTGRDYFFKVSYILHGPIYGLAPGWVIMS